MAMENKRIIQLSTERTTLGDDDYTIVDSGTNGTAKYRLSRLKETDTTLSVSGMAADAAATGHAISEEAQARTQAVTAETQARQQAITAESQARQAADTALGNDVDDLKSAINDPDTGLDTKAPVIVDTASGAIATFPDGAEGMNVKDLKVKLSPIQDLHGYDHPWPAGGGKNLAPLTVDKIKADSGEAWNDYSATVNGITFTIQVDSSNNVTGILVNGTNTTGNFDFYLAKNIALNGTYLVNGGIAEDQATAGCRLYFNPNNHGISNTDREETLSNISDCSFRIFIVANATISNKVFKPMIRLASESDATFEPYSNICPISGLDEVEVKRTGKNLLPNYKAQDSSTRVRLGESTVGNGIFFKAGTYKISFGDTPYAIYWRTYKNGVDGSVINSDVITITEDSNVKIWVYSSGGVSVNDIDWAQVELGSTATDYEPYTSHELTSSLPETVYGGTLDLETGELVADWNISDLSSVNWIKGADGTFYSQNIVGKKAGQLNICCSKYAVTTASVTSMEDKTCRGHSSNHIIYVRDTAYADATVAQFKTAMSGVQLCYELATPITYTLTPKQLETVKGINHISANGNTTIDVDYYADTKLYIEKLTKPTEDDMIANQNIPSGKFFMVGNSLYLSTSAIASGETIIVGTNCTAVSLADALNTLNS